MAPIWRADVEDEHDLLAQARDLLYARLLEYRAFRDAAVTLAERLEVEGRHRAREVELEPRFRRLVPDAPLDLSVEDLARLGARATAPRPEPTVGLDHIRRTFLSIRDAAGLVLDRLATVGTRATFDELVDGRSRADAVVVFLAALELYKLGHVELDQVEHRGPLGVSRREATADLQVLRSTAASDEPPHERPQEHSEESLHERSDERASEPRDAPPHGPEGTVHDPSVDDRGRADDLVGVSS